MYKRKIAPATSRTAKHSAAQLAFVYQQAHILSREMTHDTYA